MSTSAPSTSDPDLAFSRNSSELLRRPSFSLSPPSKRGFLKKLASNGRLWNKRFFVVHGHYLSYFKNEDGKQLMGAINLWRIESVALENEVVVVTLAPDVQVTGNTILNRFARKTMRNRILLQAATAAEANDWIAAMRVAPFEEREVIGNARMTSQGVIAKAKGSCVVQGNVEEEDIGGEDDDLVAAAGLNSKRDARFSMVSNAPSVFQEKFRIETIRVRAQPYKDLTFADVPEFSDTIRLRLGSFQDGKGTIMVRLVSCEDELKTFESTCDFRPESNKNSGVVYLTFKNRWDGQVAVYWEKDSDATVDEMVRLAIAEDAASSNTMTMLTAGMFIATFWILWAVLEFSFNPSVIGAFIMSISAASILHTTGHVPLVDANVTCDDVDSMRYVVTGIRIATVMRTLSSSVPVATKITQEAAARKKTSLEGEDLSIFPEEREKIKELRKRVAGDLRALEYYTKNIKTPERLLQEWNVDPTQTDLNSVINLVYLKYVGRDFRLVRFLRARDSNLDKAEKMLRHSLIWRVGLRSDFFMRDFIPPSWILQYGGGVKFVESLDEPNNGTEARLAKWWLKDTQGGLAMFFRTGAFDWKRVYKKVGDSTLLVKIGIWALELGRKDLDNLHEQTIGAIPSYVTAVVDMEGFSLTQQIPLTELVPIARKFFSVMATSYPELLKRVIVINTPFLFHGLWQAIKVFIPEEVQEKIHIHGRCDFEKHLKPYFTEENIPAYLGGKLYGGVDGKDPYCRDRLPPGGPFREDKGEGLLKSDR